MAKWLIALGVAVFLSACETREDLKVQPAPLGDFRLGHNIAIADNVVLGPFSREISELELEKSVQDAVAARLRRYDGDGLYHLGVVIGGIVLAQPGLPVIYAPRSVMLLDVTLFDNRTQEKINEEPFRVQVGEGFRNSVPFFGTGYVRAADAQLANLVENAADEIEEWLLENPDWFEPRPDQVRVPYTISTPAPDVAATVSAQPVN